MKNWIIAVLVGVIAIGGGAACGDGGASERIAELEQANTAAREQIAALTAERDTKQNAVEALTQSVDELTAERDSALAERGAAIAERDSAQRLLASTRANASLLAVELDAALLEVERLRLTYDEEIRADLIAQVNAEVERACKVAGEEYERNIRSIVSFQGDWVVVTSRAEIEARVEECASPERNKTAAQREAERLADCETISVDQIEKGRSSLQGECFTMFARIVQYDTATGVCSFHANISSSYSTNSWEYDVRSTFGYRDDEGWSSIHQDCPELDNIDQGDFVRIWATYLRTYSYGTTAGGTNHVPSFKIEKVELWEKD